MVPFTAGLVLVNAYPVVVAADLSMAAESGPNPCPVELLARHPGQGAGVLVCLAAPACPN